MPQLLQAIRLRVNQARDRVAGETVFLRDNMNQIRANWSQMEGNQRQSWLTYANAVLSLLFQNGALMRPYGVREDAGLPVLFLLADAPQPQPAPLQPQPMPQPGPVPQPVPDQAPDIRSDILRGFNADPEIAGKITASQAGPRAPIVLSFVSWGSWAAPVEGYLAACGAVRSGNSMVLRATADPTPLLARVRQIIIERKVTGPGPQPSVQPQPRPAVRPRVNPAPPRTTPQPMPAPTPAPEPAPSPTPNPEPAARPPVRPQPAPSVPERSAETPAAAAIRAFNGDPAARGKVTVTQQPDGSIVVQLNVGNTEGNWKGAVNYFIQPLPGTHDVVGQRSVFPANCDLTGLLAGLKAALTAPSALPTVVPLQSQEFLTPEKLANPNLVAGGIADSLNSLLPGPTVGAMSADRYPGAGPSVPAAIDLRINRTAERFALRVADGQITLTNPNLTITLPARPGMTTLELARGVLAQVPQVLMLSAIESSVGLVRVRNRNVGAQLSLFGTSVLQADGRAFNFGMRNGNYVMDRADGTQTLIDQRTPPDVYAIVAAVQRAESPPPTFNAPKPTPPELTPAAHDARLRAAGFEKTDDKTNVLPLDKLGIPRAIQFQMCIDMGIPPTEAPRLRVTRDPSGFVDAEIGGVRQHLVGGDRYRGLYNPTRAVAEAASPAALTAALQAFKAAVLAVQPVFSANPRTNAAMLEIFNGTQWSPAEGRSDWLRLDKPAKDGQPAYTLIASVDQRGQVAYIAKLVEGVSDRGYTFRGVPGPLSAALLRSAEETAARPAGAVAPEDMPPAPLSPEARSTLLTGAGFRKLDARVHSRDLSALGVPRAVLLRLAADAGSTTFDAMPELRMNVQPDGSVRPILATELGVLPARGYETLTAPLAALAAARDAAGLQRAMDGLANALKALEPRFDADPATNRAFIAVLNATRWKPTEGGAGVLRISKPRTEGVPAHSISITADRGQIAYVQLNTDRSFRPSLPRALTPENLAALEAEAINHIRSMPARPA